MVNLIRKQQKVFAQNATNNGQFGSLQAASPTTTTDTDVIQALTAFLNGWNDAVISGEELPALEEFQALHFLTTRQISYLLDKGIPEWEVATEYFIGDIQREVGGTKLYKSITDNNIGNALTDVVNWQIIDITANDLTINKKLNTQPNAATISSGAITYSGAYMVVDTEAAAASDDLDTINGGNDGDILIIRSTSDARDIVIKHITGNIRLRPANDTVLSTNSDKIALQYNSTTAQWEQISRSVNVDFLNSKATNGYTYLPNGLIFQWGTESIAGNTTDIVTLPVAYSDSQRNASATYDGTSTSLTATVQVSSLTTTQLSITNSSGGTATVYWQSVGD